MCSLKPLQSRTKLATDHCSFPKWSSTFIEISDFSTFKESDKTLKHKFGSCWHCPSILISNTRSGKFEPFYHIDKYFYRPHTKYGEGNVFTCVCHSVHAGSALWGGLPSGVGWGLHGGRICMEGCLHGVGGFAGRECLHGGRGVCMDRTFMEIFQLDSRNAQFQKIWKKRNY